MSELSVQLYTVRDALAQDFDGTLGKLAAFGFTKSSRSRSQVRGRTTERTGPQRLDRADDAHAPVVKIRTRFFDWQPTSASRPSLSRTSARVAGNRG